MSHARFGPRSRASSRKGRLLGVIIVLSILISGLPSLSSAAPTPAEQLSAKRAEAARVQDVLDAMDAKLEGISEAVNKIEDDLAKTDLAIIKNQFALDEATRKLEYAQAILNARVASIYRAGEVDVVGVMLGTSDFDDLLARIDFLGRIGAKDAEVKVAIAQAKDEVERIRRELQHKRAQQTMLRAQLRAKRDDLMGRVAAKGRYLESLNNDIQRLVAEERERQRRIAEALARQALGGTKPSWYPQPEQIYSRDKVVDIALAQLGKPYQWGATGPGSFDCSGLMLYVYAYVGVYLPRVSQEQARVGTPVAKGELLPGDLVYFGYGADPGRVHHIGMYIGDGNFIHAPRSGDVVKISVLSEREDYAGAARP